MRERRSSLPFWISFIACALLVGGAARSSHASVVTVGSIGNGAGGSNTGTNAIEGHNGFEKNAALQAAYPLAVGDMVLMPHLGLQYVRLDENEFAESGAGSFDLAAGSSTNES